jgi:hypothetical protein
LTSEVLDLGSQRVVLPAELHELSGGFGVFVAQSLVFAAQLIGHLLQRPLLLFPAFAKPPLGFSILHPPFDLLERVSA